MRRPLESGHSNANAKRHKDDNLQLTLSSSTENNKIDYPMKISNNNVC